MKLIKHFTVQCFKALNDLRILATIYVKFY